MVGVSLGEPPEAVREWGADFGIEYPLWVDPTGGAAAVFGVRGHPTTILIDRQGRIVARIPGERDWRTPAARRLLDWLLEQR